MVKLRPGLDPASLLLGTLAIEQGAISLVQIGAHVGKSPNDPLSPFLAAHFEKENRSRAVLVEPVKYLFERLVNNYRNCSNIEFENSAIAEKGGWADFCYFKELPDSLVPEAPWWISQIGTLLLDRMKNITLSDDPEINTALFEHLVQEKVPCLSLRDLLEKYHLRKIDFLQIDTEGYDFKLLSNLDFSEIRPQYIQYEHFGLSEGDQSACRNLLARNGYELIPLERDTLCCRVD